MLPSAWCWQENYQMSALSDRWSSSCSSCSARGTEIWTEPSSAWINGPESRSMFSLVSHIWQEKRGAFGLVYCLLWRSTAIQPQRFLYTFPPKRFVTNRIPIACACSFTTGRLPVQIPGAFWQEYRNCHNTFLFVFQISSEAPPAVPELHMDCKLQQAAHR